MSRLQELMAELCPDGVEYKDLGEIFEKRNGYTPSKNNSSYWEGGTIPWFRMEDIRANGTVLDDAVQHVTDAALKKGGVFPANSIIVATSATIGAHALITCDFLCNQRFTCLSLREAFADCFDLAFLNHYFVVLDEYCLANVNQGSFASVKMGAFDKFRIPVPPIEVQREVVRILDEYTAAHDELVRQLEQEAALRTASLTAFCDHEISRPEFKRCPIHEVGQLERGRRFTAADYVEDGIPSIHYGEIYTAYGLSATRTVSMVRSDMAASLRYAHPGDVVIACTGENKNDICKAVAWLGDVDAAVHDDCQILHHESDSRFIAYALMTSEFHEQKVRATSESKVVRVSSKKLASLRIPLPPIEEQHVTANRLDEIFSAIYDLITSLDKEKLNLEEQLALVRNQLLSFPEKVA